MTSERGPLPTVAVDTDRGFELTIRPLVPGDEPLLLKGFEQLSDHGRYSRFFSPMPELKRPLLERLSNPDQIDHLAIGATLPPEAGQVVGAPVGIARAFRASSDPSAAELAVTVIDSYQGNGVGRLLIRALAVVSIHRGISALEADLLATNRAMGGLIRSLGGTTVVVPDDRTVVRATLDTAVVAAPFPSDEGAELVALLDQVAVGASNSTESGGRSTSTL